MSRIAKKSVQEILLHIQEACCQQCTCALLVHVEIFTSTLCKAMSKFQITMHCKLMETYIACFFLSFLDNVYYHNDTNDCVTKIAGD